MKKYFAALCLLAACSSAPHNAKYKEEKNVPKFSSSRSYIESPDNVLRAARAALDDLSRESDPPVAGSLKGGDETISTGWVYSTSKDKYVEFTYNGSPKRKPLRIRRKYAYTVTPSLSGSEVLMTVEEELMKVDLKTGEEKGWNGVEAEAAAYNMLAKRLGEKLRAQ